MTATSGSLIDRVVSMLQGYTVTPDQVTYLNANCTATDLTLAFGTDGVSAASRGIVEIDDELIYLANVDQQGNAAVLPGGRGWKGSVAATHTANTPVTIDPVVPRFRVREALQESVANLWPDLFVPKTTTFTFTAPYVQGYALPDDCEMILDVRWLDYYGNWQRVRGWEVEGSYLPTPITTTTGKQYSLRIGQRLPMGRTVSVIYGTRAALTADTQGPADIGLSPSALDLLLFGALYRVVPALDLGRLATRTLVADQMGQTSRPLGGAFQVRQEIEKDYMARLAKEQDWLRSVYPVRSHFTR